MKLAYPVATPEVTGRLLAWSGELEAIASALAGLGYAGVELFVRNPAEFDAGVIAAALARHGLAVAAIGTGPVAVHDGLTFTHADKSLRERAIARACAIVNLAAELGTQVNVGKLRGAIGHHADAIQWRDDGFRAVCDHAVTRGVRVTLEPQTRGVIANLNTTAEAIAWIDRLNLPGLSLMLDSYHMHHEDASLPAALEAAKRRLIHIHVADTGRLSPGRGEIDFPLFLRTLQSLGYEDFLTVEINQVPDSAAAAAEAAGYLFPLLQHLRP